MTCVFRFQCPPCRRVALAGTFNNWSTNANPLDRIGKEWETTIDLPPGDYEYCYFVFEDDSRPPKAAVHGASRLRLRPGQPEPVQLRNIAPIPPNDPGVSASKYA